MVLGFFVKMRFEGGVMLGWLVGVLFISLWSRFNMWVFVGIFVCSVMFIVYSMICLL